MASKVLLFGAYGNGNIGDTYQARSVARHLRAVRPELKLVATSASAQPYPFDENEVFAATKTIRQPEVVNQADALIIGGGGLLASLHRPLGHESWVDQIEIPIVILGVGANEEVSERCEPLLRKAAIVTARDEYSLGCIQKYRPDATYLNDPILCDPTISPVRDGALGTGKTLTVVPRKMTPKNEGVYTYLADALGEGDRVASMFPSTDRASGALPAFEKRGHKVAEPDTLEGFCDELVASDFVVSERYHGCILGIKMGVPTIGMTNTAVDTHSKIASFYGQLGLAPMRVSLRSEQLSKSEMADLCRDYFDWALVRARIDEMSTRFRTELDEILTTLSI